MPIEECVSARVYKPANHRKVLIWGVIIAMYSAAVPFCYNTAGEARAAAIIQAQKLADERWEAEQALIPALDPDASDLTQKIKSVVDIHEDAEFDSASRELFPEKAPKQAAEPSWLMSWFTPSKEQRRAEAEFKKFEKEFKEKNTDLPPLPPEYLPSAWAVLSLLASMTFHALFFLLCRWIPQFKASCLYQRATVVSEGCFVLIVPPPNRGKAEIVTTSRSMSNNTVQLEFQRQKYFYVTPEELGEGDRSQFPNGVLTLSSCPVDLPITSYLTATGLRNELEIQVATERYGKNHLAVHIPSFLELLKNQLLSPLSMFQVFCAMLWLLDEYWTYTIWTLVMVVVFEASTVFQRTRTQKMLGGMAPKGNPIFAYRAGKWQQISTKELLPGDLISMSFHRTEVLSSGDSTAGKQKKSVGDAQVTFVWDGSIPCDCLILKGSAVVNEASLTGESIPQMKEALTDSLIDAEKASDTGDRKNFQAGDSIGGDVSLDINSLHRVNTLFSGTMALTVDGEWGSDCNGKPGLDVVHASCIDNRIPHPPDNGMVAYVLRTGFGSSQGALMQMIEFSQQSVQGDSRETGYALLMLFIFALISSGYVLYDGLQKQEKTTHEILLKCVIIITSVVPRQFPMQMAMAVNMALMALTKAGVFCTEPFRVPLAGKISHILFDKTGTLTTDQLEPVGIIAVTENNKTAVSVVSKDGGKNSSERDEMIAVEGASDEAAMVLAACHSLVSVVDNKAPTAAAVSNDSENQTDTPVAAQKKQLAGDPIELAAVKSIGWTWDAEKSTATPGRTIKSLEKMIKVTTERLTKMRTNQPKAPTAAASNALALKHNDNLSAMEKKIQDMQKKLAELKIRMDEDLCTSIQVLHRHHFSSGLQRMSVVCNVNLNKKNKKSKNESSAHFVLVKGSPEAVQSLSVAGTLPEWYAQTYERLARRGLRVLALACKRIDPNTNGYSSILDGTSRSAAECDLHFVGFIAFECKVRADSAVVVRSLRESDHCVSMLTGDALLTSLHVAKKVGICDANREAVTLQGAVFEENADSYQPNWLLRHDDTGEEETIPVKLKRNTSSDEDAPVYLLAEDHLQEICKKYNLLTTEAEFFALASITGGDDSVLWKIAGAIRVFARMSPQGKATIIRHIKASGEAAGSNNVHVMMCGDGGNDVGALKEADVGLALLVGHASANTTEEVDKKDNAQLKIEGNKENGAAPCAEDILNARDKEIKERTAQVNKLRQAHMKAFQAKYTKDSQEIMQKEIADLTAKGEYMAMFSLMKSQATKQQQALNAENKRFMAMHGHIYDPKRDVDEGGAGGAGGIAGLMEQLESADGGAAAGGLPMIKPGDASVAAPFTSRVPSVRAVVDLIRQGRCTLLSALMQQEIMMLESTIYAYTLSALSLHNARSSERQMMASSWLIMTAAVSFSYASPVDKMHPMRPLQSLFHPAIIISVLGQAAIHIACMTLAVHWATEAMGPEQLKEVTEFFKRAKAKEIDSSELCDDDDMMCAINAFWMAPFMPNLLNSVVFLVETGQMIAVYFANYKGRPWMKGMLENHPLFLSVYICIAGVVIAAWEMVPQLNEAIQLAPFPNDAFRYKVVLLVVATIFGTLAWDRFCTWIFAPTVFAAMWEEARKTTAADLLPVMKTALMIVAGVFILGTGNVLLMAAAGYYWWKSRQSSGDSALGSGPPAGQPALGA